SGVTATAQSFNGEANITIPITNVPGTLVTGTVPAAATATTATTATSATSATKLATARTIGVSGVTATAQSFDGTGNITIPITNVPGALVTGIVPAATNATSATKATSSSLITNSRDGATNLSVWVGTQAQYDAIATKNNNTIYNII
ncbi:MAG: hypothetical protein LUE98_11430, partial [Tannerellaceae bacterium]|nr:hypothetical protein [Tannerellaceae bacterium]